MQFRFYGLRPIAALVALCATTVSTPQPTPAAPQPGMVKGKAFNAAGKPLPNVEVSINGIGSKTGWLDTTVKTSASGAYWRKVDNDGTYRLSAAMRLPFKGKSFITELHPADNKSELMSAKKGIEKNFVLKLTGRKLGSSDANNPFSYYGCNVRLSYFKPSNSLDLAATTPVKFTLMPIGKLADGSTGKPLVFQRTLQDLEPGVNKPLGKSNVLHDIPLGTYKMTAIAVVPGRGEVPMPLGDLPGTTGPFEIEFKPARYGGGTDGLILTITNPKG